MTDKELHDFLFPRVLTRRRKIVINIVMLCVTIFAAWAFNSDASIFSFTRKAMRAVALILRSQGWHFVVKPTPEQLYGCPFAVADQHNGECP